MDVTDNSSSIRIMEYYGNRLKHKKEPSPPPPLPPPHLPTPPHPLPPPPPPPLSFQKHLFLQNTVRIQCGYTEEEEEEEEEAKEEEG